MKEIKEYLKQGHRGCFCCREGELLCKQQQLSNRAEAKLKRSSLVPVSVHEHTKDGTLPFELRKSPL